MSDVRAVSHYLDWSRLGRATYVRYLVGLCIVIAVWQFPRSFLNDAYPTPPDSKVAQLLILSAPALGGLIALYFVMRWLGRPGGSVALPARGTRWSDLFLGLGIGVVAIVVMTVGSLRMTAVHSANLDAGSFLPFLAVAVIGLLLQVGYEEAYYRGYTEQLMGRITRNATLVILLPALGFAFGHKGNIDGYRGGFAPLLPYLVFGLTMAYVAWQTGSLLMSVGLHWANNLMLALVVSTTGDVLPSMAPFVRDAPTQTASLIFAVGKSVITVLVVRYLLKSRHTTAPTFPENAVEPEPVAA